MPSPRPELRLDWCSHEAARYACERWHYSRTIPKCKIATLGVWEDNRFIGSVIFGIGSGASCDGRRYGLRDKFEVAELVRVALTEHQAAVSRIVSIAARLIQKQSPGVRLLVSYADPAREHHGGIYQAAGWVYCGRSSTDFYAIDQRGRKWHSRTCSTSGIKKQYGVWKRVLALSDAAEIVRTEGKYKYLLPLDADMRDRIAPLAKPYPKRVKQATDGHHPASDGAAPIHTLQSQGLPDAA